MTPPAEITMTGVPASANSDPLTYVLAVCILAGCALLAWRRRNFSPAQRVHGPWSRAAISSLIFGGSLAILMLYEVREDSIGMALGIPMVAFVLFGLGAFPLICLIEVAIWRIGPTRSRRWLVAAPIMFALAFTLLIAGGALAFGQDPGVGWDLIQPMAVVVGTSLAWWSYLPARSTEVGRLFE